MTWGSKVKHLKELQKQRGVVPDALKSKPELHWILQDYLNAFLQLHGRRQYTMGAELPLPISEIRDYAETHGFEVDFRFFFRAVVEMDNEHFLYQSERNAQKPAKSAGSAPPKRPARRSR